jgi:hypothetical protein
MFPHGVVRIDIVIAVGLAPAAIPEWEYLVGTQGVW